MTRLTGGPTASSGNTGGTRFATDGTCYQFGLNHPFSLRSYLEPGESCFIDITPNPRVLVAPASGAISVNDSVWINTSAAHAAFAVSAVVSNDVDFYTLGGGSLQAQPVDVWLARADNVIDGSDTKEVTFVNPHTTNTTPFTDTINFVDVPPPFVRSGGTCPSVLPAIATAGCTIGFAYRPDPSIQYGGPGARYEGSAVKATAVVGFAKSNRAVELTAARPESDDDNDGIPYAVELAEGRDPLAKDNAIFAELHPNANRWFAMQQYRDFLSREAEVTGLAGWTNLLNTSMTREAVIQGFFSSPEFQSGVPSVVRLYLGFFKRIPDSAGLKGWVTAVRGGTPLGTVAQAFAQSAEFQRTYGALTNAQFVTLVYQNVLGRAPDTAGYNGWLASVQGGMSRGDMMVGFTESTEYQLKTSPNVFVIMMYESMLRRAAEQAGYDFWVNYVNNGRDALELTRGFLNSPEYRNRFLP
jgi:Domain of unknown function (DUF4214)